MRMPRGRKAEGWGSGLRRRRQARDTLRGEVAQRPAPKPHETAKTQVLIPEPRPLDSEP